MGFINTKDPNGVVKERELRTKEAEARRAIPAPEEFGQLKLIQDQEKLLDLKDFNYINGPIGVNFGVGFNDSKTYYSLENLEKQQMS